MQNVNMKIHSITQFNSYKTMECEAILPMSYTFNGRTRFLYLSVFSQEGDFTDAIFTVEDDHGREVEYELSPLEKAKAMFLITRYKG